MLSEDFVVSPKNRIRVEDLREADVLLSCGDGILAALITTFDASPYSHAQIWAGDGSIIEATSNGVTQRAFDQRELERKFLVDVYRRREPFSAAQVVQAAGDWVGQPYGWGELRLAGLVVAMGRVVSVDAAQRGRFTMAARGVLALLRSMQPERERMMTCSMLIAKAFRDGGAPLQIRGGYRSDPCCERFGLDERLEELRKQARWAEIMDEEGDDEWGRIATESAVVQLELLSRDGPKRPTVFRGGGHATEESAAKGLSSMDAADPLELTTPADIAQSESMELLGRMYGSLHTSRGLT